MKYRLDKGCHSVYSLQFHLVMCVKYRKKVLVGVLDNRLKEIVRDVAKRFGIEIIEQETDKDHIHILFASRPPVTLSKFVNSLKSVSSRILRKEFPDVMSKHLWAGKFWSDSYFIASTGQVKLEDIKHYVSTQKEK
ncbi:transposase IS200-family protein [Candidatus Desulfofervidus auxilii]|uniref:Transposase IS200-family protein n=1 Tax=Desulfofervidus auxilii TaxID=1621989 RepID=A0A7U4QJW5_DESA2|nr:IS200/IS605 family transposase [Candidatus Desulfofervidus auxilii]AMM40701.1 transposase IS200-family protein [Candidatus Desulfofervidus auxilii]CAD7774101.1 Transposase IS200 like protein [Candidatus Methanoperedenaceae archaeon GB50]CAD7775367.1 Transposase IS200 like protein [Candidatus Methanoperedenaceae archaeon GB37]CAD7776530.1 Transposase IS200 like protein [Candidatus Methanoperedenaceae archaeon GB37]